MTTSATAVLIMDAQDRASAKIERTRSVLEKIQAKSESTALRFISLSGALAVVGLTFYSVTGALRGYFGSILDAQRATGTLQNRLMLLGFSGDRAASTVDALRSSLNRTAFTSLPGLSAAALETAGAFDADTNRTFGDAAKKLEQMTGVPAKEYLEAIWVAAKTGDVEPLNKLGLKVANLDEFLPKVNANWAVYLAGLTPIQRENLRTTETFDKLMLQIKPLSLLEFPLNVLERMALSPVRLAETIGSIPSAFNARAADITKIGADVGDWITNSLAGRIVAFLPTFSSVTVAMIGQGVSNIAPTILSYGSNLAEHLWHGLRDELIKGLNWVIENVLNRFLSKVEGALNVANRLSGGILPSVSLGRVGLMANPADEARRMAEAMAEGRRMDEAAAPFERLGPGFPTPNRGRPQIIVIPVQIGDRPLTEIVLDIIEGQTRLREPSLGLR